MFQKHLRWFFVWIISSSSHNHKSGEWVPTTTRLVSSTIGSCSTSVIVGGTGKHLEDHPSYEVVSNPHL